MFDNLISLLSLVNYLAVLVAGLSGMIVAGLWYNPKVMGGAWLRESGLKESELGNPAPAMIRGLISNIVLAFGLASFFAFFHAAKVTLGWDDGAAWGFGLAVLIHGAAGFPNYVFEKRSTMLFLIHIGNSALGMAVMGAILASWN